REIELHRTVRCAIADREDLRLDRIVLGIVSEPAVVSPGDDEAAIGKRGDAGHLLTALRDGVDHKLAAELVAIRIQDLRPDRIVGWVGIRLALILPDDGKVTAADFHDPRQAQTLTQ